MKTLCFQIQFSPCDNQATHGPAIEQVLRVINAGMGNTAEKPHLDGGKDYVNITVAIANPLEFWSFAKPNLPVHSVKLIVVAEGEHGWDDYLLLYHFDDKEFLDDLPSGASGEQTM